MTSILNSDPPANTLPYGQSVYVDDGTQRLGTVEQVTGGSSSRGILRTESIVSDPRLTSDGTSPSTKAFGSSVDQFVSDLAASTDPSNPIASAHQFITGDPQEYRSAVAELGKDSTIQRIAIEAADYGIAPNATIGSVVKSGIGAGILSKVLNVAAAAGSDSGTSLIGVEAGSVALTLGAM